VLGPVAELKLKNVESVTNPKIVRIKLDDWAQFKIALDSLLIRSARQVLAGDRTWVRENSATANAEAQLDAIKSRVLKR